jgi:hypothetical protein
MSVMSRSVNNLKVYPAGTSTWWLSSIPGYIHASLSCIPCRVPYCRIRRLTTLRRTVCPLYLLSQVSLPADFGVTPHQMACSIYRKPTSCCKGVSQRAGRTPSRWWQEKDGAFQSPQPLTRHEQFAPASFKDSAFGQAAFHICVIYRDDLVNTSTDAAQAL